MYLHVVEGGGIKRQFRPVLCSDSLRYDRWIVSCTKVVLLETDGGCFCKDQVHLMLWITSLTEADLLLM